MTGLIHLFLLLPDKHLVGGAQDGWLMIYDKVTGFHVGGCQDPKKPSHAAPVGLKQNARMNSYSLKDTFTMNVSKHESGGAVRWVLRKFNVLFVLNGGNSQRDICFRLVYIYVTADDLFELASARQPV